MSRAALGALEGWEGIVPPREMARVERMAREYEELAARIDGMYDAGATEGVEDLEVRAERLLEDLAALWVHYREEGGEPEGEGASVEEQLAWAWLNRKSFASREDWIDNMRDAVVTAAIEEGKRVDPTDEELVRAAEDAAARRVELRRRYKGPERPGMGAIHRYKVYVETPGGRLEESVHTKREEANAFVRRALEGILDRAEFQLEVFSESLRRRPDGYYWEAVEAIDMARDLLDGGQVENAVGVWQAFEELDEAAEDGGKVGPPPLWPNVGRIRVEMD